MVGLLACRRGQQLDLAVLLESIVAEDLTAPHTPAFLLGRALWVTSRCGLAGGCPPSYLLDPGLK